jgi:hypothetical protein
MLPLRACTWRTAAPRGRSLCAEPLRHLSRRCGHSRRGSSHCIVDQHRIGPAPSHGVSVSHGGDQSRRDYLDPNAGADDDTMTTTHVSTSPGRSWWIAMGHRGGDRATAWFRPTSAATPTPSCAAWEPTLTTGQPAGGAHDLEHPASDGPRHQQLLDWRPREEADATQRPATISIICRAWNGCSWPASSGATHSLGSCWRTPASNPAPAARPRRWLLHHGSHLVLGMRPHVLGRDQPRVVGPGP